MSFVVYVPNQLKSKWVQFLTLPLLQTLEIVTNLLLTSEMKTEMKESVGISEIRNKRSENAQIGQDCFVERY